MITTWYCTHVHNVTVCKKKIDQGSVTMASSITAELELLPLEGTTNSVWAHVGFPS